MASTSRTIEAHLMALHHISKTPAQRTASRRYGGQKTIHEAIGVSTGDSQQQTLSGKLQLLFNAENSHLLLMDWIVMNNLPFWVVESERFCRFVKSVNPMAWIPTRHTIINLVTREYQQAIPHIKALSR
jgi:hypothetical protein